MEIVLTRRWKSDNSTLSTIKVDGVVHQYCLEDKDRGLTINMTTAEIATIKIFGKTAIPKGRYQVVVTYSNRFKRLLPVLVGVPGFAGIRIHPGNRHNNTEGCLLPGKAYGIENGDYIVMQSRTASDNLQNLIASAISRNEKVWIEIKTEYK